MDIQRNQLAYLRLLSTQYPSIDSVSTAIIELNAELNLPKGTEHFISDIHGEYGTFCHVLRSCSGAIKSAIDKVFDDSLSSREKWDLATLIYYPEQKVSLALKSVSDAETWYFASQKQLIKVCRYFSARYTHARVRRFMPAKFAPIIEELLYEQQSLGGESEYAQSILESVIATGSAQRFIFSLAKIIRDLAITRLHVIGDIYDRGPGAHLIMDNLIEHHRVDIQWGNHDIVWMGAAAGSEACIANVVRMCLRYANLETLENGYGISLLPLASFAIETYADDACERFSPKLAASQKHSKQESRLMGQMHKAIAIIQFKLESQIIQRRPQYGMGDRLLLQNIDYAGGTIRLDDTVYPLLDTHFPTIDPDNPYELTAQEESIVEKLKLSFENSGELQKHVRFLYAKGGMYLVHNDNLLYHGCIAMNEDGSFKAFKVAGEEFSGKSFMDRVDRLSRQGYFSVDNWERKLHGMDAMWYLWCGAQSPLFGKEKMATFERYFIADKVTHKEERNAYYELRDNEESIEKILAEFGVNPHSGRVINGHVPVQVRRGESPVKAGGKLLVIDGGFSRAYQNHTGIAGYSLVSNASELLLVAHVPFESVQKVVEGDKSIEPEIMILDSETPQRRMSDTDEGRKIQIQIDELYQLHEAYQGGMIKASQ